MIDFTGRLGYAFCFAATGATSVGRIAVMPSRLAAAAGRFVNLIDHPWAERPRRLAAFGVITTEEPRDLKSEEAKSQLSLTWYEFPISDSDRTYLKGKYVELVRLSDDPSAGFLRFHITEYVEAREKFSTELTD